MMQLTSQTFDTTVLNAKTPTIVMFYASWCSKCAMMKPVAEEFEKKYHEQIRFFEIDIEKEPALAEQYGADIVPTFLCFQNGTVKGGLQGLIEENVFEQRIKKIFRNS
ncbi:MAG: thioredoxin family protein [Dorea sp.]